MQSPVLTTPLPDAGRRYFLRTLWAAERWEEVVTLTTIFGGVVAVIVEDARVCVVGRRALPRVTGASADSPLAIGRTRA